MTKSLEILASNPGSTYVGALFYALWLTVRKAAGTAETLMQSKGQTLHSFRLWCDFDVLNGIYFAKRFSTFLHHTRLIPLCFTWNSKRTWKLREVQRGEEFLPNCGFPKPLCSYCFPVLDTPFLPSSWLEKQKVTHLLTTVHIPSRKTRYKLGWGKGGERVSG